MCNRIFWIILAWLFLGNQSDNGCSCNGNCASNWNTCGCDRSGNGDNGCSACSDDNGCDRVRVVRNCGC